MYTELRPFLIILLASIRFGEAGIMMSMDDSQKITYFGETDTRGNHVKFGIRNADRTKHFYVIGKSGMGKSTLLENMAVQDIQEGRGICFIDPHGGTAEKLLEYIPEERIKDVVYFAPFDTDFPLAFNVMEDVGPLKRHLVLSGLMSAFEKVFGAESFSDRMQYILQNTILALLEYPNATMLGINKMLSDKTYRNDVIAHITDPSVKTYWTKEFAGYTERFAAEAIPAIQNKIGQFTSNPLIRNIIGQPKSSFDLRKILDEKKILIVNLSKGRVGEGNARLLGSMLVTKIYLAAMSRADESASALAKLPPFYLYVDEFQSFADKSFADILSEARKYKLALTMAHQYIEQMEEEVRDAVFGNVGTMVTFRVGSYDAEVLEKEFSPTFVLEDIVNLGRFQMYLKLMIDNLTSQPFSGTTLPPIALPSVSYVSEVIDYSRKAYAKPRVDVEEAIAAWHGDNKTAAADDSTPKAPVIKYPKKEISEEAPRASSVSQAIDTRGLGEKSVPQPEVPKVAPKLIKKPEPAVSLKEIVKKEDNQRKPDQKNVSALRDALQAVVKKEAPKTEPVPRPEPKPQPKPAEPAPPQRPAESKSQPAPAQPVSKAEAKKEPSTDELKKLLGVE